MPPTENRPTSVSILAQGTGPGGGHPDIMALQQSWHRNRAHRDVAILTQQCRAREAQIAEQAQLTGHAQIAELTSQLAPGGRELTVAPVAPTDSAPALTATPPAPCPQTAPAGPPFLAQGVSKGAKNVPEASPKGSQVSKNRGLFEK